MKNVSRRLRAAKLAALLVAALGMGACAKNPAQDSGLAANASAAVPGSQQDFVVNVGDRVFFDSDSSELTPQSPIALMEYAHGLQLLDAAAHRVKVLELYQRAAACRPLDAVDQLDCKRARRELAAL